MRGSKGKKVLLPEGPGFSDPLPIQSLLMSRGDTVRREIPGTPGFVAACEEVDFVLVRGPWFESSEERLWCRVLGARLKAGFEKLAARQFGDKAPRVVGLGRGALLLLDSGAFGLSDPETLRWEPALTHESTWVEVQALGEAFGERTFLGLVLGRLRPQSGEGLRRDLTTWLCAPGDADGAALGYKLGHFLRFSWLDLLAFEDRSQSPDFGYRELQTLPTRDEILGALVDGSL